MISTIAHLALACVGTGAGIGAAATVAAEDQLLSVWCLAFALGWAGIGIIQAIRIQRLIARLPGGKA